MFILHAVYFIRESAIDAKKDDNIDVCLWPKAVVLRLLR